MASVDSTDSSNARRKCSNACVACRRRKVKVRDSDPSSFQAKSSPVRQFGTPVLKLRPLQLRLTRGQAAKSNRVRANLQRPDRVVADSLQAQSPEPSTASRRSKSRVNDASSLSPTPRTNITTESTESLGPFDDTAYWETLVRDSGSTLAHVDDPVPEDAEALPKVAEPGNTGAYWFSLRRLGVSNGRTERPTPTLAVSMSPDTALPQRPVLSASVWGKTDLRNLLARRTGRLQQDEDSCYTFSGGMSLRGILPEEEPHTPLPPERQQVEVRDSFNIDDNDCTLLSESLDHLGYRDRLTELFFIWYNPWLNEIDEEMYFVYKSSSPTAQDNFFFSAALETAILAIGATYSQIYQPMVSGRPCELFARRAKVLIQAETSKASLASIQTLMLLSQYEFDQGRLSQGFQLHDTAMRMATSLGFHHQHDQIEVPLPFKQMTADAQYVLANTWKALLLHDIIWRIECGRRCTSVIEDLLLLPSSPLKSPGWSRHVQQARARSSLWAYQQNSVNDFTIAMTELVSMSARVSNDLYVDSSKPIGEAAYRCRRDMHVRLQSWMQILPSALQVNLTEEENAQCNRSLSPHTLLLL
ncbi:Fungal specific transcription factor domain-containing protein [Cladophialophora immunda]|nr:Fungal specific transcription factor domain-containing protein [Cladophialophora immunda]